MGKVSKAPSLLTAITLVESKHSSFSWYFLWLIALPTAAGGVTWLRAATAGLAVADSRPADCDSAEAVILRSILVYCAGNGNRASVIRDKAGQPCNDFARIDIKYVNKRIFFQTVFDNKGCLVCGFNDDDERLIVKAAQ